MTASGSSLHFTDGLTGKRLRTFEHGQTISSFRFSPTGRRLVTVGETVNVWDSGTGQRLLGPIGPIGRSPIGHSCIGPDDRDLLLAFSGSFNVFDMQTRHDRLNSIQRSSRGISHVTFTADGRHILTNTGTGVRLWDAMSGAGVWTWEQGTYAREVTPYDGERQVLVIDDDGFVRFLDRKTGRQVRAFFAQQGNDFAVSPNEQLLAISSVSGVTRVWDLASEHTIAQPFETDAPITRLVFSPATNTDPSGGRHLLTCCRDGTARVWNVRAGEPVTPLLRHGSRIIDGDFSSDGTRIVTAGQDGAAIVWTLPDPETRSPRQLQQLACVLSSRRLDGGVFKRIGPTDVANGWEAVKVTDPRMSDRDKRTWHERQADDSRHDEHWYGVAFHTARLIDLETDPPAKAGLHRKHGHALLRTMQPLEAIESYTRAIQFDPHDSRSFFHRGRALAMGGLFVESLTDLKRTAEIEALADPADAAVDPAAVWLMRSVVSHQENDQQAAEAAFARAVELRIELSSAHPWSQRPSVADASAHGVSVPLAKHRDDWDSIEAYLTREINALPDATSDPADRPWLWRSRGLVYAALGDWPAAVHDFRRSTEELPDDPHAWHGLARSLAETEPDKSGNDKADDPTNAKTAHAKRLAEAAVRLTELAPESWSARRLCVRGLLGSQQFEPAVEHLDKAIELTDESAEMRFLRGHTHSQLRQFKEAAADFARASELDPDNNQARYRCAIAHAEAGQWTPATNQLTAYFNQNSGVTPSLIHELAVMSLMAKRLETYQQCCAILVKAAQETGDEDLANMAAWISSLGPNTTNVLDDCVKLAQQAAKDNPDSYPHLNTLAAVLARSGRHEEAAKQAELAIAAHGQGGTAMDWLFQALTARKLNQPAEAQKLVDKSVRWFKQLQAGEIESKHFPTPLKWSDRAEYQTLLAEDGAHGNK